MTAMTTTPVRSPAMATALQTHSEILAHDYPGLDEGQAQQFFERLADVLRLPLDRPSAEPSEADPAASPLDDIVTRFPFTLLERALEVYDSPQEAVVVLLAGQTPDLVRYALAADYLFGERPPLLLLEELQSHFGAFIAFLEADCTHLVRTGLPQRPFHACMWLYRNLGRLYGTRRTFSPTPAAELFPDSSAAPAYRWLRDAGHARRLPHEPLQITNGDYRQCTYEAADLLPRLDASDARRLDEGRSKFFDLKIALLQLLLDAASRQDATGLGSRCRVLLTDSLSPDEIEFYFRLDHHYLGRSFGQPPFGAQDRNMIPGGLTNLLETAGHVEQELTVGAMRRTREALDRELPDWSIHLHGGMTGASYFAACRRYGRGRVDAVLARFIAWAERERLFWLGYRNQVDAIRPCNTAALRLPEGTTAGQWQNCQSTVQAFADLCLAHQVANGLPPTLAVSPVGMPPPSVAPEAVCEYQFRRNGDGWSIRFREEDGQFKDRKGLQHIHRLLASPRQSLNAQHFYHAAEDLATSRRAESAAAYESPEDLPQGHQEQEAVDKQTVREVRAKIRECEIELQRAQENKVPAEVARLQRVLDSLKAYLKNASSAFGGKRTLAASGGAKAKNTAETAIRRAYKSLEKSTPPMPKLALHLRQSIQWDASSCSYSPTEQPNWVLF
ncbi:MAG: hypothetical protein JNM56_19980 [Planctomycetia bacterium]|nr:hypothetical protein [Planctomycetia bacterium]